MFIQNSFRSTPTSLTYQLLVLFLKRFISFYCTWLFCLHVCLYTICMPGACRGPKRVLDDWELDWQMVVSCSMILGTEPMTPARAVGALNPWAISPVLYKDPDAQKSATHQNITNQVVSHESWFSADITSNLLTGCPHVWEHSRPGQLPAHIGLGRVGPASPTILLWRSRRQDAVLQRIYTHKHSSNTDSLSFKDTMVSMTLNQSRDCWKLIAFEGPSQDELFLNQKETTKLNFIQKHNVLLEALVFIVKHK